MTDDRPDRGAHAHARAGERLMPRATRHTWAFQTRFRRHAFGWRSQPAIQRFKEAAAEIGKSARTDPLRAAEGAVLFLERVSPAIERVDSSSGSIGTAVRSAIAVLVPIIVQAPAADPGDRGGRLLAGRLRAPGPGARAGAALIVAGRLICLLDRSC